eukprot:CAMPEP_0179621338 /NCGR_PEP_ID=MMETSP0932-20121108/1141_1 /TAXON_ID=548131 ORGANISM="Ostreococcus mediterraneus, Strain clade-D-RCC2596" /NCGR_SAMPLE_ID=MMETSP0932 /ASSEMBLY_ACC=CAM_ASM_000582 /LENGTH=61 /DNA_ID=CAMNT_0021490385 /DNA_START=578 /DNA_END=760 /DNA_ORIENTATION=+
MPNHIVAPCVAHARVNADDTQRMRVTVLRLRLSARLDARRELIHARVSTPSKPRRGNHAVA